MDNKDIVKKSSPETELPKPAAPEKQVASEIPSTTEKTTVPETTPVPEKKAVPEQQADFSSIFNVASEEGNNQEVKPVKKEQDTKEKPIDSESIDLPESTASSSMSAEKQERRKKTFNGEEKLLYEILPEKESNPIVPALFFITLIALILLLPYLSKKVSFDFTGTGPTGTQATEEETPDFYFFNKSSVRAKIGDLEFTNFIKSNIDGEYRVSFNITNVAEKTYQFDKKYYIVLYNEKEQVLYRGIIHSFEAIGALAAKQVTLNVTKKAFDDSDRFKIVEIPTSTYPEVKLTEKEGEYEVMTCVYNFNTIKYYFIAGELAKIYDVYKEDKSTSYKYDTNKEKYKKLSNGYKGVTNFSSIFIETDEYFQMVNEFDLKIIPDATMSQLQTYRFFKYKENKDVISFELEAQAYTCS